MYYSKIYKSSILDGPGVRVALYVSGCRNHCEGCHNPESWNFTFGKEFTQEEATKIFELLKRPYCAGLSIVGGEPFEEENQKSLLKLVKIAKDLYPEKTIWCWTGYELEELVTGGRKHTEYTRELLDNMDVLVEGRFILAERDISDDNRWRGSRNQRVVDLNETRKQKVKVFLKGIPNNE